MAVVGIARQHPCAEYELPALAALVGDGQGGLYAELVPCSSLALADAFDLGRVLERDQIRLNQSNLWIAL